MENYIIKYDILHGIYVARHKKFFWLTGYGKFPENAVNMAEENLKTLRCPKCGWADQKPFA
jgi:hypothetical protein